MNGHDAIRRLEKLRENRRVRKGMFVLPSLFTAGNIAAGLLRHHGSDEVHVHQ